MPSYEPPSHQPDSDVTSEQMAAENQINHTKMYLESQQQVVLDADHIINTLTMANEYNDRAICAARERRAAAIAAIEQLAGGSADTMPNPHLQQMRGELGGMVNR